MTTKKIDEIDKNLKVVTSLSEKDIRFFDGCHPNDAGFLRMAEVIGYTVNQALQKSIYFHHKN